MSRIILNTKTWLLFVLLFGISFSAWAQSDDFNTWTKFKVNHMIDSQRSNLLTSSFMRNSKSPETENRESILWLVEVTGPIHF